MKKELREKYKQYLILRKSTDIQRKMQAFDHYMKLIESHQTGRVVMYDEMIDFFDYINHTPHRYESFARKLSRSYPPKSYPKVLNVGCGMILELDIELIKRGYEVSSMDPKVLDKEELIQLRKKLKEMNLLKDIYKEEIDKLSLYKQTFDYQVDHVSDYDLCIGLEPCEATEHIIRACLKENKDFMIGLCASAHDALDGTKFKDFRDWYKYLRLIDPERVELQEIELLGNHHMLIKTKQKGR